MESGRGSGLGLVWVLCNTELTGRAVTVPVRCPLSVGSCILNVLRRTAGLDPHDDDDDGEAEAEAGLGAFVFPVLKTNFKRGAINI